MRTVRDDDGGETAETTDTQPDGAESGDHNG